MVRRRTKVLAGIAAIFALIAVGLLVDLWQFKRAQDRAFTAQAQSVTASVKTDLEDLLANIEVAASELGETFGERDYTRAEIESIVRDKSLSMPELRGVTACFEPFAYQLEQRLFCPYYNKASSEYIYVEDSYDYTERRAGTAWYTGVIDGGANWAEPYFGDAAQDWFIDYGVPFYWTRGEKTGQVRGMIDLTLQAEDFRNYIHIRTVGKTGYEFLTTKTGTFVAHPIADYVGNENLETLKLTESDPALRRAYEAMEQGKSGLVKFYDEAAGDDAIFIYDTLAPSDYRIGVIFYMRDVLGPDSQTSRRIINIALALSAFLINLTAMIFGRDYLDAREIEQLSWQATSMLIALVVLVGFLEHGRERVLDVNESAAIVDSTALGDYVATIETRADRLKVEPPVQVPVGIWIERLEFADSYNVNIGGEIWAQYPETVADEIEPGLRFPQISPFAESAYIEEVRRELVPGQEGQEGYLHVVWEYRVTLRLNLRYADFPFDKRQLDIEIVPTKADNIMFVPALGSYEATNPSNRPGLSADINLPGNTLTKSYFNFSTIDFPTDFGYGSKSKFQSVPVLHYNIYLKRKLFNAFITYLIPIFVALSLIYILILACEKTEARQGIIESMAAFFFVLIFSHIDLRKDIVTADLIFIEYFYFATYLMIILSTANLIAYTKSRTSLFDYNENQLYRAAYFPIFFMIILVAMLWKFY